MFERERERIGFFKSFFWPLELAEKHIHFCMCQSEECNEHMGEHKKQKEHTSWPNQLAPTKANYLVEREDNMKQSGCNENP